METLSKASKYICETQKSNSSPRQRQKLTANGVTRNGDPAPLGGTLSNGYSKQPALLESLGKAPGGRPKALAIAGEKILALRGDASQEAFCRLCKISTDTLQKAERGTATEKTIIKICKYAAKKGQNLTPEELKIN